MTDRVVACFPANKALAARMQSALDRHSSLESFNSIPTLSDAIRSGRISATVVIVDAATFDAREAILRRLHLDFPSHPLVAHYNPRGLTQRHLLQLAQSGITDLVQLDVDDSRHVFGKVLDSAERVTHAQILADRLSDDLPATMRPLFRFALERAGQSLDVPQLAAMLGVHRRTLSWRFKKQHMPKPQLLVAWCKMLVAALLLEEKGRTLDSVADQLDFPSGHALGAMFFRYFDRGVASLREDGVSEQVIQAFRREIGGDDASLPVTLPKG